MYGEIQDMMELRKNVVYMVLSSRMSLSIHEAIEASKELVGYIKGSVSLPEYCDKGDEIKSLLTILSQGRNQVQDEESEKSFS